MALTLSVGFHCRVISARAGDLEADGVAETPTVGTAGAGAGLSHMESRMQARGPARAACMESE